MTVRHAGPYLKLVRAVECQVGWDFVDLRLSDGRVLRVPFAVDLRIGDASPADRQECEIVAGGLGLAWPTLGVALPLRRLLQTAANPQPDGLEPPRFLP
jgi:hypothetical protein